LRRRGGGNSPRAGEGGPADILGRLETALGSAYRIERELGGGGMSHVFLAEEVALGRKVVVKVLRAELAAEINVERFKREIALAAQLQHPHIVPLLAAGDADGLPYYLMPFVEGESLREVLARRGELPVAESVSIIRDVCRALAYAHQHGVVHRDIKPDNVLLSGGSAVVADFGVAKAVSASADVAQTGLTSVGVAMGTPAYMAPEQAAASPKVDQRADLYALGVMAYEMLTGQAPFAGRTPEGLLAAHVTEAPEAIAKRRPALPADLATLVMRLLEKRPADRPQTADEVLRVLDAITTPSGGHPPTSARPAFRVRFRSRAWRVAWGGAAVVVLAGAAWLVVPRLTGRRSSACGGRGPLALAVLPFDVGADTANEYFAEGLSDELAGALGKVPGLRVAGRTSSYRLKGQDTRTVGQRLNVTHVVEATVRRSGSRVRVSAQLVCAADEFQLWGNEYEREVRDVFAVQDSITSAIVGELRLKLVGAQLAASRARRTENPEAHDLYWRARYSAAANSEQGLRLAIDLYHRALAVDSTYALAYAGIATAWGWLGDMYLAPAEVLPMERDATLRALALDSSLAEAHAMMAFLHATQEWDIAKAMLEFRRALALDSTSTEVSILWANLACLVPRLQTEGLVAAERAVRMDPLSPLASFQRAICLYAMRRYGDAATEARHLLSIDSTFFYFDAWDGASLRELGDLDSALAVYRRAQLRSPDRPLYGLAITLARMGRRAEARQVLRALEAYGRRRYVAPATLAAIHVALGDFDAAFAALDRALAAHDASLWLIGTCPEFDAVRNDPRLAAIGRRVFGDYDTGAGAGK
jgi:TolB-like protein/tRNA A-37 threonylcarbamoyl transferase component Bud32